MVATQLTVAEQVRRVAEHPADPEIRVTRLLDLGKVLHQGDVYLHLVADNHPRGEQLGTRQVAVGVTVGSRHIADGDGITVYAGKKLPPSVKVPSWCRESDILGPVVVVEKDLTLTHPEHAHHKAPVKAGTYQVTYQADFSTRSRVQD